MNRASAAATRPGGTISASGQSGRCGPLAQHEIEAARMVHHAEEMVLVAADRREDERPRAVGDLALQHGGERGMQDRVRAFAEQVGLELRLEHGGEAERRAAGLGRARGIGMLEPGQVAMAEAEQPERARRALARQFPARPVQIPTSVGGGVIA